LMALSPLSDSIENERKSAYTPSRPKGSKYKVTLLAGEI
jgi:hypothetical protein